MLVYFACFTVGCFLRGIAQVETSRVLLTLPLRSRKKMAEAMAAAISCGDCATGG